MKLYLKNEDENYDFSEMNIEILTFENGCTAVNFLPKNGNIQIIEDITTRIKNYIDTLG